VNTVLNFVVSCKQDFHDKQKDYNFSEKNIHRRTEGMYRLTFWHITSCSPLKVNGRFRETCRLNLQVRIKSQVRNQHEGKQALLVTCSILAPCLVYFLTLKINETSSSETLVGFQWTTRRYIPDEGLFITTAVRTWSPTVAKKLRSL
jgi:hypothetical protein